MPLRERLSASLEDEYIIFGCQGLGCVCQLRLFLMSSLGDHSRRGCSCCALLLVGWVENEWGESEVRAERKAAHPTHHQTRIIRTPRNERNLVPLPLPTRRIILDIIDRIPRPDALLAVLALGSCRQQLLAEGVVIVVGRGLFDDNVLPVVGDFVDDPFDGFAEFQVVKGRDAFGVDGDAGLRGSCVSGLWMMGRRGFCG